MEPRPALLGRAHVSVISAEADAELDATARMIAGSVRVSGQAELARLLDELLAAQHGRVVVPRTLDLYGHSTARTAQLRLGDWVIEAASASEQTFWRDLAERAVLPRLGITSVRLLACRTADTDAGRATMCRLAELLGVEVYGTRHLLYDAHHDANGFLAAWQFLLVSASELRRQAPGAYAPMQRGSSEIQRAAPIDLGDAPRRLATPAAADQLLALLRRDAGAPMPGSGPAPSYVVMLPAAAASREPMLAAGAAHEAHVLFDGAFVRLFPDGPSTPGVVYPVDDPAALRALIASLAPPPAD